MCDWEKLLDEEIEYGNRRYMLGKKVGNIIGRAIRLIHMRRRSYLQDIVESWLQIQDLQKRIEKLEKEYPKLRKEVCLELLKNNIRVEEIVPVIKCSSNEITLWAIEAGISCI